MNVGTLYMALIGRHHIPDRMHQDDLTPTYHLQPYLTEVIVPEQSTLIGKMLGTSGLREQFCLHVLRIEQPISAASTSVPLRPNRVLHVFDRLVDEGNLAEILRSKERGMLELYATTKFTDEHLSGTDVRLVEVAIAPNASVLGRSIRVSMFVAVSMYVRLDCAVVSV